MNPIHKHEVSVHDNLHIIHNRCPYIYFLQERLFHGSGNNTVKYLFL